MPNHPRRAGQNIRNLADTRRIKAIYSFLSAGFILFIPAWLVGLFESVLRELTPPNSSSSLDSNWQFPPAFYGLFLLLSAGLVANGIVLWRRANRADQGAKGEEDVAQELVPLEREGWQIEYGLMLRGRLGDADIICISPQGRAYVIDVKSHRGNIQFDGKRLYRRMGTQSYPFEKDFLGQVMKQALQVKEQKGLAFVTPILAFSQAKVGGQNKKLRGVYVIEKSQLRSLLQGLG